MALAVEQYETENLEGKQIHKVSPAGLQCSAWGNHPKYSPGTWSPSHAQHLAVSLESRGLAVKQLEFARQGTEGSGKQRGTGSTRL